VPELVEGFALGHWTDPTACTGCSVILPPEGSVAAAEVRGGGPGTRESELLQPAASVDGVDAVLLTGGSAHGLAAADGVVRWLSEQGRGYVTAAGRVPLVTSAVVFDLAVGDGDARPGPGEGYAACVAGGLTVERGSVGVGAGCTVGKLHGPRGWCRGGLGFAACTLSDGTRVQALAAVNAFGDVLGEDGTVVAGVRDGDVFAGTVELLRAGASHRRALRESTTLACVMTDAALDKRQAWLVARAAGAGIARAVSPCATAVDGDMTFCLASGARSADPFAVAAVSAEVVAAAVRDGVRSATPLPGCPAPAAVSGGD
jgi:L-aminopeptidase/D-esterase-like protein